MNNLEQIKVLDKTFNESEFISKVNNIYIMLLSSISNGNLKRVEHKISDKVLLKYENIVNNLNEKNQRKMYDELNVKSTHIDEVEITDKEYIIHVSLVSRYMEYIVDKSTNHFISGNNQSRIEKFNNLVLIKKLDTKNESIAHFCPYCGSSVDVNNSGTCKYCRKTYPTIEYDWILDDIN